MNLDGAPRVLGKHAAASQPASSCEDFDKKLLTLLETASVDKVVELLNYHIVRELRLSGDYLSIDGFTTLTVALPKTQVTRLHMASCGITDDYPVAKLLDEHSKLAELDLSSNRLTFQTARSIGSALGRNAALLSLDLSHNHLDHAAYYVIMRYVCAAIGRQSSNRTLQELSFKGNSDGEMFAPLYEHLQIGAVRSTATTAVAKALANLGAPGHLICLDLSNTGLMVGDPHFEKLVHHEPLTLRLDGNASAPFTETPQIDQHTGGEIVQTTSANLVTSTTTTVLASTSAIASTVVATPIALKKNDPFLQSIELHGVPRESALSNTGLMVDDPALAKFLGTTTRILVLGGNPSGAGAVPVIAGAHAPLIDPHSGGMIYQTTQAKLATTTTAIAAIPKKPSTVDPAVSLEEEYLAVLKHFGIELDPAVGEIGLKYRLQTLFCGPQSVFRFDKAVPLGLYTARQLTLPEVLTACEVREWGRYSGTTTRLRELGVRVRDMAISWAAVNKIKNRHDAMRSLERLYAGESPIFKRAPDGTVECASALSGNQLDLTFEVCTGLMWATDPEVAAMAVPILTAAAATVKHPVNWQNYLWLGCIQELMRLHPKYKLPSVVAAKVIDLAKSHEPDLASHLEISMSNSFVLWMTGQGFDLRWVEKVDDESRLQIAKCFIDPLPAFRVHRPTGAIECIRQPTNAELVDICRTCDVLCNSLRLNGHFTIFGIRICAAVMERLTDAPGRFESYAETLLRCFHECLMDRDNPGEAKKNLLIPEAVLAIATRTAKDLRVVDSEAAVKVLKGLDSRDKCLIS